MKSENTSKWLTTAPVHSDNSMPALLLSSSGLFGGNSSTPTASSFSNLWHSLCLRDFRYFLSPLIVSSCVLEQSCIQEGICVWSKMFKMLCQGYFYSLWLPVLPFITAEKQPGGVLWNSIVSHGTSGNVGVISGCHNDRGTVLALSG